MNVEAGEIRRVEILCNKMHRFSWIQGVCRIRRRHKGFGGGSSEAAAILQLFSKKYILLGIFWSKFLFNNSFKWQNKV